MEMSNGNCGIDRDIIGGFTAYPKEDLARYGVISFTYAAELALRIAPIQSLPDLLQKGAQRANKSIMRNAARPAATRQKASGGAKSVRVTARLGSVPSVAR
jgi:hypothetical protein